MMPVEGLQNRISQFSQFQHFCFHLFSIISKTCTWYALMVNFFMYGYLFHSCSINSSREVSYIYLFWFCPLHLVLVKILTEIRWTEKIRQWNQRIFVSHLTRTFFIFMFKSNWKNVLHYYNVTAAAQFKRFSLFESLCSILYKMYVKNCVIKILSWLYYSLQNYILLFP